MLYGLSMLKDGVFVQVRDRKLLQDLAREKLAIDAQFAALRNGRVQSTILNAAPHLAWNPV